LNFSDAENSELNNLSSNSAEDAEIVDWGEGNLAPVHDMDVEASLNEAAAVETAEQHGDATTTFESSEIIPGDENQSTPIQDIVNSDSLVDEVIETPVDQADVIDLPDEEDVPKEQATLQLPKQKVSGWQRLWQFIGGGSADIANRMHHLTQAIEDAPESPVNYVLRAELYLKMREYALAQADFQRAYELADVQFQLADWGLVDQVMRDRALAGLEKVKRRLR
jgi:tetratricopeptide (TPR) repeat protein